MKKFLLLFSAILLSSTTWAQTTFTYNDIVFTTLDDSTCEVGVNTIDDRNAEQVLVGKITIPDTAYDRDGKAYSVVGIGDEAFSGCYAITTMEIPSTVTYIGEKAFYQSAMEEIEIPGSVKTIGENAFRQARDMTKLTLNEGLVSIGEQAFMSCAAVEELTIPSTVESLGEYVFDGMEELKTVTILAQLTELPRGAFQGCSSMETINIPETVKTIGNTAFWYCIALKDVTLPEGLESIEGGEGRGAFGWCQSFESITIPDKVTKLDVASFYSCTGLKEVVIGNSIETIYDDTFLDCTSLETVTIGNSVKEIYLGAFENCSSLEEITLPETVEYIEHAAFLNCESLATVYSLNPTPPDIQEADEDNGAFTGIAEECVLYVPKDSKEAYESAYTWKDFYEIKEIGDDDGDTTGISGVNVSGEEGENYYSVGGQQVSAPQKGVNIVRLSDGTTKKVLVK